MKTAAIKMTEGQFNTENKFTQAFENVKADYKEAMQVPNPNYKTAAFNLMDLTNTPTMNSEKAAIKKGYTREISHKDDYSFERYTTPTMVIELDKTNTHKTGVAYLRIKTK
jgi:hypothetical protein